MKIIEQPITQVITCPNCGSVLEVTKDDLKTYEKYILEDPRKHSEYTYIKESRSIQALKTECPVCTSTICMDDFLDLPTFWKYPIAPNRKI